MSDVFPGLPTGHRPTLPPLRYGCSINPLKTQLNFDMQLDRPSVDAGRRGAARGGTGSASAPLAATPSLPASPPPLPPLLLTRNVWRTGDGSEYIRWCGLLLNVDTLEVRGGMCADLK